MRSRIAAAGAACLLVGALVLPRIVAADVMPVAGPVVVPDHGLSVLSYNVEGLPWPAASARGDAAQAIADDLRALHAGAAGPSVVAVQEAFGPAEKRIGIAAGYRYAAFGPSADLPAADAGSAADRAFAQQASLWHGETIGHVEDSGLAVFSDYPIVWTRRMAFPDYACAGWDCLANKGALAVALRVPGVSRPVVIVDTHLNSRVASGVGNARAFYAYRRQVDLLGRFVADAGRDGGGLVLAGDFNVGRNVPRSAYLGQSLLAAGGLRVAAAEAVCGQTCRMLAPDARLGGTAVDGTKGILAYRPAAGTAFAPQGRPSSFGITADGRHLSDHIGIARPFGVSA